MLSTTKKKDDIEGIVFKNERVTIFDPGEDDEDSMMELRAPASEMSVADDNCMCPSSSCADKSDSNESANISDDIFNFQLFDQFDDNLFSLDFDEPTPLSDMSLGTEQNMIGEQLDQVMHTPAPTVTSNDENIPMFVDNLPEVDNEDIFNNMFLTDTDNIDLNQMPENNDPFSNNLFCEIMNSALEILEKNNQESDESLNNNLKVGDTISLTTNVVIDNNVTNVVVDNNITNVVVQNNVANVVSDNNFTVACDYNAMNAVCDNNAPTAVCDDHAPTAVCDNNAITVVFDNNVTTVVRDDNAINDNIISLADNTEQEDIISLMAENNITLSNDVISNDLPENNESMVATYYILPGEDNVEIDLNNLVIGNNVPLNIVEMDLNNRIEGITIGEGVIGLEGQNVIQVNVNQAIETEAVKNTPQNDNNNDDEALGDVTKKMINGSPYYTCDICNYGSIRKPILLRHTLVHTGEKCFACSSCKFKTSRKWGLQRHMETHSSTIIKCNLCEFKTTKVCKLEKHIVLKHTADKQYSCTECDFRCSLKKVLEKHRRTHSGEKPFKCEMCDQIFTRKGSIALHIMNVHVQRKRFSCRLCKFTCARKHDLTQHFRTHTGEKPFACPQCDYKCCVKGSLTSHMRTHSGERPYKCTLCSYEGKQMTHLTIHMLSHTKAKPFACEKCDYTCRYSPMLTKHMAHHNFKCRCRNGCRFRRQSD